jgi:phage terminase large subunit
VRILCTREVQNTIKDSVFKLLTDQMVMLGIADCFKVGADTLKSWAGSEFIFKGLRQNIEEIKSTEGIDIVWIEEGEKVSRNSWDTLIPTIRKEDSEIIVTFNPDVEKSDTYQRFVVNTPPDAAVRLVNWHDNPWFPEVLRREMEYCKKTDYDKYRHIWEGECKGYAEDLIFRGKICVEEFETPGDVERFFFGADFGFSNDPTCLVRMFIKGTYLYIDYEAYGHGVEITELPGFFRSVPGAEEWKIVADSERPDTISYLHNEGFDVEGAEKGKGSVEDGIQFLRSFEKIIIHPRCTGARDDFESYRWKRDKHTEEILPVPKDGSDHAPDATRYALESYIKQKVSCWDVI